MYPPRLMDIDIELVKRLMRALRRYDLTELDILQGDQRIRLRRNTTRVGGGDRGGVVGDDVFPLATGGRSAGKGLGTSPAGAYGAATDPSGDPGLVTVTAELVGTFYRSAAPGARPFVEVGTTVRKGSVLCIIEAMKLMNEIEAELEGTVTEVLVENGRSVEFGDPLFRIRRSG